MGPVIIGVDPHKRSATIEIVDQHESVIEMAVSPVDLTGCLDVKGKDLDCPP